MPPWAQTLCERLTGVRLIRSTSMPSSASFMAAAKPASPPPTIITRLVAIEKNSRFRCGELNDCGVLSEGAIGKRTMPGSAR